jgi:dTDP-4-amino-4,6-dideoxygalactose transaminase
MRVPFIDLSRTVQTIRNELLAEWQGCLDRCEFVGGQKVDQLEKELEKRLDSSHVIGCSNGTDALIVGLQAIGVKPGMRVALPNMTFWAPFEAIVQLGAIPVLVDIDMHDLQMDFDEFQQGHEKFQFDAAILVHLFGWTTSRLDDYRQYCRDQGIMLVEDGAQAFAVSNHNESVFKDATLGTLSFYPAKVLGAAGDAGAITTPDPKIGERIRALCNHGRAGHYTYDYVGWNSRMGGLQASFLLRMLEHIDGFIASRLKAEAFYHEFFTEFADYCQVHRAPDHIAGNGYLSVIYCKTQSGDDVAAALKQKGIGCARTYPQTLCEQPPAQDCLRTSDLQRSRDFSKRVINLPLFAGITPAETQAAAEALLAVFREGIPSNQSSQGG